MQTLLLLSEVDSLRWLAVLLDAAAKSLVLVALAGGAALLLHRSSAAVRHMVWMLAVIGLLCLPVLSVVLPQWQVPVLPAWARIAESTPAQPPAALPSPAATVAPVPTAHTDFPLAPIEVPVGNPSSPSEYPEALLHHTPGLATPVATPAAVAQSAPSLPWPAWVLLIWAMGIVLMALPLLLGTVVAWWQTRRARPIADEEWTILLTHLAGKLDLRRTVSLRQSAGATVPATFGIIKPAIVLPAEAEEWGPERRTVVLLHELAHVKRADCLTQALARLARALYWFNPLVWLACRMLRLERERACDDLVLSAGHKPSDYAGHLLEIVRTLRSNRCPALAAVAMAQRSQFEGRLLAILDPQRSRSRLTRLSVLAAVVLVASIVLPLSIIQVRAAENPPAPTVPPGTSPPTTQAASPDTGSHALVTGIVVDETGQGVSGVTVTIPQPALGVRPAVTPTLTGPDGRFALDVGLDDQWCDILLARLGDTRQGYLQRAVDGQRLPEAKITLKPARQFPITVKDDKGSPVSGATVAASSSLRLVSDEYKTDADGQVTLRVPADAPLQYTFALKDNAGMDYFVFWDQQTAHADPYHLAPDYAGPLSFVLNGVTPVTVVAEDEAHQPLTDATVYPWLIEKPRKGDVFNMSGLNAVGRPARNGRAEFLFLPIDNSSKINFWVFKDAYTSPQRWLWDPKSGTKEITATLIKAVHLTGQVSGQDGQPVGGAEVRIWGEGNSLDQFRREIQSGSDGTFAIDVDPEKFYTLSAQKGHDVSPPFTRVIHRAPPAEAVALRLSPGIRVYGQATAGPKNEPAPNAGMSLIYHDEQSYKDVPREEQLPSGETYHGAIAANVVQNRSADTHGHFEFYTFPGKHTLDGFFSRESTGLQEITVENDDKEVAVHFQNESRQPAILHGRVVRADQPDLGVAEAVLYGQIIPDSPGVRDPQAIADRAGNFQIQFGAAGLNLHVLSPDKKFGAVVTLKREDDNVTIRLAPTGSVKGRLLDKSGKPAAGQTFRCSMGLELGTSGWRHGLSSNITTKTDGTFILDGLVPGQSYALNIYRLNDEAFPPTMTDLGMVKPEIGKIIDLGDKTLGPRAPLPDPQAVMKFLEGSKGLDTLAADLTKAIGGQWTAVNNTFVRGEVRTAAGAVVVSYDVYPLDWPTFRDGVGRAFAPAALKRMSVLGSNDQYTVTESRDRPSANPPQSQKIMDFLKLKPTPGLGTTQPAR